MGSAKSDTCCRTKIEILAFSENDQGIMLSFVS